MKLIFLGTNGWYDSKTGNTVCTLIETKKEYLILDAGNGIYKIDQYIKKRKPIYLFLSHFHLDHIFGLHVLDKFRFPQGINLFIPPKSKKFLKTILNQPYTVPLTELKKTRKLRVHEIGQKSKISLSFEFKKLLHASECFGYRFYLENKIVAYCTDTGICDNLYRLARNADLLIAECAFKSGQREKDWPHLNPEDAALVAKKAQVKKLVLTHFDANRYQTLKEREIAEAQAQKIFPDTTAAKDDLEINL